VRSRTASAARRGFTLLEVMVAMSILAMGLVVAFEIVGGALQNHVRARNLEVATLLARGRLAEAEAKFQEDGFRDSDENADGNFDAEGHPEITWALSTTKPTVELGAEGVIKAMTGADGGLEGLLGMAAGAGAGQPSGGGAPVPQMGGAASLAGNPLATTALAFVNQQLSLLGEEIKKGVRQVRLTVSWPEGRSTESFTVVTHMVLLGTAAERAVAASQADLLRRQAAQQGQPQPQPPRVNK